MELPPEPADSKEHAIWAAFKDLLSDPSALSHSFPAMSSAERKLVHHYASQLNLSHKSEGKGAQRRVVVSKKQEAREGAQSDEPLHAELPALSNRVEEGEASIHFDQPVNPPASIHLDQQGNNEVNPAASSHMMHRQGT